MIAIKFSVASDLTNRTIIKTVKFTFVLILSFRFNRTSGYMEELPLDFHKKRQHYRFGPHTYGWQPEGEILIYLILAKMQVRTITLQ